MPLLAELDRWLVQAGIPVSGLATVWLAGCLVLVGVAAVVVARIRAANAKLPESHRNRAGRRALAAGEAAQKRADWRAAAEHFVAAGLVDRAVALYLKENRVSDAADVLIAAGRSREAAMRYKAAGKWSQAGRLFRQVRAWREAAEMFDKGGEWSEAAAAWEAAGALAEAGARYRKAGELAHAVRVLERSGDTSSYVTVFVEWWEQEMERQMGRLEPASYWLPAVDRALDTALQSGQFEAALKLAGYAGRWDAAAQSAERLGRFAQARRFYERLGDAEGVARMAEALGDYVAAAIARAEAAERAGNLAEAAEFFERGGQSERAMAVWDAAGRPAEVARVAEALGLLDAAAAAWERAGEPGRAAPLYGQTGRWMEAGAAWERAGDLDRAAEALRKAEDWLGAARLAEARGNTQAAIRDLQQQLRVRGQNREIALRLIELMMREGMRGAAISLLEPLVTMQPATEADADLLYKYGMLLEEEGRAAEAARAYDRIQAFDLGFRDARERAQRLRMVATGMTPKATVSQPTITPVAGTGAGSSEFPLHPDAAALGLRAGGDTQRIFERYTPKGELGRGGMGVVIKAHDKVLDRLVALKLVETPGLGSVELDRLLSEARATARLNHPNIVQIYDCTIAQNNLLMAMEFVEGQTVKQLIESQGPLPLAALVVIFGQVLKALQYAHEQGIVHRDIKPANILWTADRQVKIADFGLARAAQELQNTQTVVVGSPYYMAPEQLVGEAMDHRVDLYALGVSMFEATTGSLPFPKGDIGYHHIHTAPPNVRDWRPDVPPALATLIQELMAKNPADRPPTAADAFRRLGAAVKKS